MAQYRKKPVMIDAWQWDGVACNMDRPVWLRGPNVTPDFGEQTLAIKTPEGTMTASAGDWIICGLKGEIYTCKPDIFAATHDPA